MKQKITIWRSRSRIQAETCAGLILRRSTCSAAMVEVIRSRSLWLSHVASEGFESSQNQTKPHNTTEAMPSMMNIHCQPCRPPPSICSKAPDTGPDKIDASAEPLRKIAIALPRSPPGSHCEVVNHAGKETGLRHAEQEAQYVERGLTLDECHGRRRDAPGQHDAREPGLGAELLQQHVGRHFKDRITDKEQTGAEAIGGRADADIGSQVGAHETDVDAVNVIDDEHDHKQRQDALLDFGYRLVERRCKPPCNACCLHYIHCLSPAFFIEEKAAAFSVKTLKH